MDYKKLAKILYPEAKPVSYWEEKYPARDLPIGAEVTRFAPSPTGCLHIGHFFQCVCNSFTAKNTGGVFFFRVEDTDKNREVSGSIDIAIQTLNAFGIHYDEGVLEFGEERGNYGPYKQSERIEIYKSYAKYLVGRGRAFPCFCKKAVDFEEIEERRAEELKDSLIISEHDDHCRNLSLQTIIDKIENGEKFALKLLSTGNPEKSFPFHDYVKGDRMIRENGKDIVLMKSDGLPVYAFAHAVDDHLMRTTLVIRGEEWYSSLASHLELFDALGFEPVKYAHNPVICKLDESGNKRKISKRKDAEADMRYFLRAGYPAHSIIEYLLNLANSNFEIWRKENPNEPFEKFPFSAEKITPSNPMFDFAKLNDVSKNYISKLSAGDVYAECLKWAEKYNSEFLTELKANPNFSPAVFNIDRDVPKPRKDIAKWEDVISVWGFMYGDIFAEKFVNLADYELLPEINKQDVYDVLMGYCEIFNFEDSKEVWFDKIKKLSEELGFATDNKLYKATPNKFKGNVALVCEFIRVAITGKRNSPDLYSICATLGDSETKFRALKLAGLLEKSGQIIKNTPPKRGRGRKPKPRHYNLNRMSTAIAKLNEEKAKQE